MKPNQFSASSACKRFELNVNTILQLQNHVKEQYHCLFCAFSLLVLSIPASADLVYGVDAGTDALYQLDTDSGNTTVVGALHADVERYTTPVSMAVNPVDGRIYIVNHSPESDAGLSLVDPVSGEATLIANGFFGDIAFDSNGTLYGQTDYHEIATINPQTGAITHLGGPPISFARESVRGLDYNAVDGLLYAISSYSTVLWKINPNDGEIVETLSVSCTDCNSANALLFNSDGTLILSDAPGQLFDIDTATGIASNMRMVTGIDPVSLHRLSPQGLGRIITPRTKFYSIPPEAFVSASGNPARTAWGSGGAYHTEARFDAMVASVHLPDGAIITGFTMYFVDNDNADLSMWLQTRSHVGTTGRIISRVESSGLSGDDHTVDSLTQITSHKVNNESNSYAVRVAAHWPGTPALRINAALLEYVIRDAP